MGVIRDTIGKFVNRKPAEHVGIIAENHADKLTCSKCGKMYWSRGRYDPGMCRECEYQIIHGVPSGGMFEWENIK